MKNTQMKLDLVNDMAEIFEKEIHQDSTKLSNYYIPL